MIIQGAARSNSAQAVWYLLEKDRGENETSRLIDVKGTISQDVENAALEWEAIAEGTRCKEFVYHISINLQEGEHLAPEQWERAVEHTALRLGLENNQRIVVEHQKEGRGDHQHVIFNRIDPETGKAVNMGHDYAKRERAARELEKEFGLEPVRGRLFVLDGAERTERQPKDSEKEQAKRNGVNLKKWRQEIRQILLKQEEANPSTNGHDIAAALERKGHMIAKGENVPFVILDPSGTPQRMMQSLGLKIKDGSFEARFGDINPENLPSVEEARTRQKDYQAEQEKARDGHKAATLYDNGGMAGQQTDALRHVRDKHKAREQGAEEGGAYRGGVPAGKSYEELSKAFEKYNAKQQAGRDDQQRQQPGQAPQQGQTQSVAIGKEKSQAEQRSDQKKARTEQTVEEQRRQAKEAMREMFERNFGPRSTATFENYEKTRGGRERER